MMLKQAHLRKQPNAASMSSSNEIARPWTCPEKPAWKKQCDEAEVLFLKEEFEAALVIYHRILKERPNCAEAKFGVRRCTHCLNSMLVEPIERLTLSRAKTMPSLSASNSRNSRRSSKQKPNKQTAFFNRAMKIVFPKKEESPYDPTLNNRHDARHVYRLRHDKHFLKSIHDQPRDKPTKSFIQNEINYLNGRGKFWRNQVPRLTVPKLFKVERMHYFGFEIEPEKCRSPTPVILLTPEPTLVENSIATVTEQLNKVVEAYQKNDHHEAIKLANKCLELLDQVISLDLEYKDQVLVTIYSVMGHCFFELGDTRESIEWHEKELHHARTRSMKDSESRSLGNLGKAYAKLGNLEKAIKVWTKKLEMVTDDAEKAWLNHEIGYGHLTLGDYPTAYQFGIASYEAAEKANDYEWLQNACILIGQTSVTMGYHEMALETYNQALYLTDITGDEEARVNIQMTMAQISSQMNQSEERQGNTGEHAQEDVGQAQLPASDSLFDTSDKRPDGGRADIKKRKSVYSVLDDDGEEIGRLPRMLSRASIFSVRNAVSPVQIAGATQVADLHEAIKDATCDNDPQSLKYITNSINAKDGATSKTKMDDNRYLLKGRVSFALPANAPLLEARKNEKYKETNDTIKMPETETPENSSANLLPNINEAPLTTQPAASEDLFKDDVKPHEAQLFDDIEEKYRSPYKVRSACSYRSRNTSRASIGSKLIPLSRLSMGTDPRNSVLDSEDML